MISQGASKVSLRHNSYLDFLTFVQLSNKLLILFGMNQVNISLIVNDSEAEQCVKALHRSFFESGDLTELVLDDEFGNGSPLPLRVENQ